LPDVPTLVSSVVLMLLVAVVLRNLAGTPAPAEPEDARETLARELAGLLRSADHLTTPQRKNVCVLLVRVPDYDRLCRECPLDEVFRLMDRVYRVVCEVADRSKGEVSNVCGGEVYVYFGRIVSVDEPLAVAVSGALEIVDRLKGPLADLGCAGEAFRGAAAVVGFGDAVSGPLGIEWRKAYTTVGPVMDRAMSLARAAPPGEVHAPVELAGVLGPTTSVERLERPEGPVLRVTRRAGAPSTGAAAPGPPARG
jgi:class 3 adenylate cyclase